MAEETSYSRHLRNMIDARDAEIDALRKTITSQNILLISMRAQLEEALLSIVELEASLLRSVKDVRA